MTKVILAETRLLIGRADAEMTKVILAEIHRLFGGLMIK